jgi:pilus assembly protein CpaB
MSKTRIIVLTLAIGSAGLAAVLAKGFIGKKPQTEIVEVNKVPMISVLVAAKDMTMGERLIDASIGWREWPKSGVAEDMITKDEKPDALTTYQNARARLPIFTDEPIIEKKLVLPGQNGFMSAILPKGYRAISVGVSERSTAGGFILPNDRVDVLLTRKLDDQRSGQKKVITETVLSNVRVLAVNQTFRQETSNENVTVTEGKTATLELDPRQTEVLAMVESAGELSLALRSIAENGDRGLGDTLPVLAEKYVSRDESGKSGNGITIIRYGTESNTASR